jgi:hypothetical protein
MRDYSSKMQFLFYCILPYPNQEQTKKKDEYNEIFILLAQNKFIIQVT